jgi:hypothetical protein
MNASNTSNKYRKCALLQNAPGKYQDLNILNQRPFNERRTPQSTNQEQSHINGGST